MCSLATDAHLDPHRSTVDRTVGHIRQHLCAVRRCDPTGHGLTMVDTGQRHSIGGGLGQLTVQQLLADHPESDDDRRQHGNDTDDKDHRLTFIS
jgi:hypothetical protein